MRESLRITGSIPRRPAADLGCHQMYLLDWLFGEPQELNATYAFYTKRRVDDSGACTALYNEGKTLAIMDSSFTSFYSPYTFELYGTKGTILVRIDRPGVEVFLPNDVEPWFLKEFGDAVEVRHDGDRTAYTVSNSVLPDDPSPALLGKRLHQGRCGSVWH